MFIENYVCVTSTLDLKQIIKRNLWTNILKDAINFKIELERYKSVRTKPVNERSFFFHNDKMMDLRGDMIEFNQGLCPLD